MIRMLARIGLIVLFVSTGSFSCFYGHPTVGVLPSDAASGNDDLQLISLLGLLSTGADAGNSSTTTVLKFLYTGNGGGGGTINMFTVDDGTGLLTANTPSDIAAGSNPWYLTAHPNGNFLYAIDRSGPAIYMYNVDALSGLLSPLSPATIATSASDSLNIIVHPNGKYAYAGFIGGDGIDMFLVDSTTGQLTANTPANLAGCTGNNESVIHPNQNFFYALCNNEIRRHSINADGTLTHLGNITVGGQANGLTITRDGAYMFATSQSNDIIYSYSVNPTTGALSANGSAATSTWANEVVVDPTGSYAFVNCWNAGAQVVRQYNISGTGVLSDNTPNSITTGGTSPLHMVIDPLGRYVYVSHTGSNNINMYSLDSGTGLLSSNGLMSAPNSPRGMALVTQEVSN